jgi:hypothetical protein
VLGHLGMAKPRGSRFCACVDLGPSAQCKQPGSDKRLLGLCLEYPTNYYCAVPLMSMFLTLAIDRYANILQAPDSYAHLNSGLILAMAWKPRGWTRNCAFKTTM